MLVVLPKNTATAMIENNKIIKYVRPLEAVFMSGVLNDMWVATINSTAKNNQKFLDVKLDELNNISSMFLNVSTKL
jgi:hypothetical protein